MRENSMVKKGTHLIFKTQILLCSLVLGGNSLAMDRSDPQSEDTFWHEQTVQLDREHRLVVFPKDFFEMDGKITFKMLKKILESPRHYNNIDKKEEWHFLDDEYIYKFESPTLKHSHQIKTVDSCYFWKEQFWNYEKLRSSVLTFNNLQFYPYVIFDLYFEKKHLFWIYRSNRKEVNVHVGILRCIKEFNINKMSREYNSPDFSIPRNNLYSFIEQPTFLFEEYNESLPPSPNSALSSFKKNPLQIFSMETPGSGSSKKGQKSRSFNPKSPIGLTSSKVSPTLNLFEGSRTTLTSIPDSGNEPLSSPPRSANEKRTPPPIFSTGNDTPRSKKLKRVQKSRHPSPDNPNDSGSPTDSSNESPKISPTSMPNSSVESLPPSPTPANERRSPSPIFSSEKDTPRSKKLERARKSRSLSPDNPSGSSSPTDSSNESPMISPTLIPYSNSEGYQKESPKSDTSINMPTSPHGTAIYISGPPAIEKTETQQRRRSRGASPNLNKSPKKSSNPHFQGSREVSPREVSPNRLNQSLPVHYLSPCSEGDRELSPQKEHLSKSLPPKPEICPSETSQETSTIFSISKDDLANMKSLEFTISLQPGLNTIKFHAEDNSPNETVPK